MEKIDIKNLRIDETEFYDEHCDYNRILERYNITKITQLFDEEIQKKIAKSPFYVRYKKQLNKLIELLKYKYLNEDSVKGIESLDENVDIEKNRYVYEEQKYCFETLYLESTEANEDYWKGVRLEKFLAVPEYIGNKLIKVFLENIESIRKEKEDGESIKVIDFIRFLVDNQSTLPYKAIAAAKVYLEIYEREKVAKDDQEIENKIQELISKREYINERIYRLRKLQKERQKEKPIEYIKKDK